MKTVAESIIAFNKNLHYTGLLPEGFAVINPFRENRETFPAMEQFYQGFFNDDQKRHFIIGINPGRHGGAITGVPFTDTKRLDAMCGIKMQNAYSHEPSSVFVYDMIENYGGVKKFYSRFYINSPFPLAIVRKASNGKWLNANYYDDKKLFEAVRPFMVQTLQHHIAIGLHTDVAFVLGKKNALFLQQINSTEHLFERFVVLEHPRFIQQYKAAQKDVYIQKYLDAFHTV